MDAGGIGVYVGVVCANDIAVIARAAKAAIE